MGVLDKLLSAVRLNDDMDDDDMLEDELEDDMDDAYDEDEEISSRTSLFKFGKKKSADDDFEDFDDEEEIIKETKKPEKKKEKQKEKLDFSYASDSSRSFSSKAEKTEKSVKSSKITPMRSGKKGSSSNISGMEVCVLKPKSMEDTHIIADTLLDNSTVILNLEGIDVELAQRISDFSFGVCYSLSGRLQKVSTYIFVLVPYNVEITGDFKSMLEEAAPSLRAGY